MNMLVSNTNSSTSVMDGGYSRSGLKTEFIDPITDNRWDRFVENHPYGWLTHHSSWKKVIEGSFDHMQGYYPALVDTCTGDIRAALPVFLVTSWLTGRKMVSVPWATLCDPLISSREEYDLLVEEVAQLSKRVGAGHVEIRALHSVPLIKDAAIPERPSYTHHYLNLDQDINCLKKSFHRTCVQQRIRRGLNSNLTLTIGETEDDLKIMYALHIKNRKSKSLPPQPYRFFQIMWANFFPAKRISLLIARLGETPVAALLLFKFKDRMSAEVAHMDDNYHDVSPNIFLFWQAMLQGVDEGYKIFDFGRTVPTNHSLLAFKSRWGTSVADITFFYYPQEMSSKLTSEYGFRYKMLKKICHYAPDCALPSIGRFCYRHTG